MYTILCKRIYWIGVDGKGHIHCQIIKYKPQHIHMKQKRLFSVNLPDIHLRPAVCGVPRRWDKRTAAATCICTAFLVFNSPQLTVSIVTGWEELKTENDIQDIGCPSLPLSLPVRSDICGVGLSKKRAWDRTDGLSCTSSGRRNIWNRVDFQPHNSFHGNSLRKV